MTEDNKPKSTSETKPSRNHVLDLKGSEQHHDLKNQRGEKGAPDHTQTDMSNSGEIDELVKDTLSDGESDTSMAAALKKAVK